jgi:hypothetical protein
VRCKTCDYRLWNLISRRCPECGTPFRPSEYEFAVNSVQFCCPHCGQSYYGTDEKGHLVPPRFACVRCGREVHMDEMVLLPTAGVDESRTQMEHHPWLRRIETGSVRGWLRTVGMALVGPGRLMELTPAGSPTASAWWFAILTTVLVSLVAMGSAVFFPALFSLGVGSVARMAMLGAFGGAALVAIAGTVLGIALWGVVAHGLICVTGRERGTLGRTYQALCYSSGANVASAIPCVGAYFGWIWWVVSAVVAVAAAHETRLWRAAVAVVTFPILVLGSLIGGYVWFVLHFMSMIPTTLPVVTNAETTTVCEAIHTYEGRHDGALPAHAVLLVVDGTLDVYDLASGVTMTNPANVMIGDTDLITLTTLPPNEQRRQADRVVADLPNDVVAHRLGDFVFTYHGIEDVDPGERARLWLAVFSPDPDANPASLTVHQTIWVGRYDGVVSLIDRSDFRAALTRQNELRARRGMPPLPDPSTVTQDRPARRALQPASRVEDTAEAPASGTSKANGAERE